MKILLSALALLVPTLSTFSDDLISKYNLEVLTQGKEGTEPKVGD